MTPTFRVAESTEPQFRLAPSTEPDVSAADVARALGAEPVGPPSGEKSMTFATLRARAAACLADEPLGMTPCDKIELDPQLRLRLNRLSAVFGAEGLQLTSTELAQRLLQISVAEADADRKAALAKLRSRENGPGGQPT
jgi:hypothetical protein